MGRLRVSFAIALSFVLTGGVASAQEAPPETPPARSQEPTPPPDGSAPSSPTPAPADPPPAPPPAPPGDAPPDGAAPPDKPKPVQYTVPWYMRPVILPDAVVRSDTSASFYEDNASNGGRTMVSGLTGIYKIPGTGEKTTGLGVLARLTVVGDKPPTGQPNTVFANPLLAGLYAMRPAPFLRLMFFAGFTLPVGGGGGDTPGPSAVNARSKGALARSGMENPIYGVNDLTLAPGFGIAILHEGLVLQLDVGMTESFRVRGEASQPEATKTNFTSGFHAGYFVHPNLSLGAEIHYQRWLDAPFAVEKDTTDATRDNLTIALGPRAHIPLGFGWLRPGISYARGLDKPMAASTPNYHIVQLDVVMTF